MSKVITRQKYSTYPVRSVSTDTGRFSRAPIFPVTPFFVGMATTPIFFSVTNVNLGEFFHMGSFGFLAMPLFAVVTGLVGTHWEVQAGRDLVKSTFSTEDKALLAKAKKKIGMRQKVAMLFRSPSVPTVLLAETDKYNMTHTTAELVRRSDGGGYAIEIETTSALKTWDLALESIVPASLSQSIEEESIAREAKYLAGQIREKELMREMMMYEREAYYKELDMLHAGDYDYEYVHTLESSVPEVVSRSKRSDRFRFEDYEYDDL